jgi:hypothetical protein
MDLSLQNGAVVMRPRISTGSINGSVMLSAPRWFYDAKTNTIVINIINITRTDIISRIGIGTVQMKLGETNYTYANIPVSKEVTIAYTPDADQDYSVAWDDYIRKTFTGQPDLTFAPDGKIPGTGQELSYTLTSSTPMTLAIKKYEVQVKL